MTANEAKVSEDIIANNMRAANQDMIGDAKPFKRDLVWRNIILMSILHISSIYGIILAINVVSWPTYIFAYVLAICSSFGITCGAHRLWCHRSYKARLPLQILLMVFNTLALENDIYEWSRDHRLHHKHSDTDADPHNSRRGFFFSHVGWLLSRKHPEVKAKGKTINMDDLANDPVIRFQRAFYIPLVLLIWGLIPTYVPHYLWGETLWNGWFVCVLTRYTYVLNITWCVNSVAHLWGMKPYDKNIVPVEANMKNFIFGGGFHNYHHTFPWDYSASEFGWQRVFNPATAFIDFFAYIGWAYDLKKASKEIIESRRQKTGESVSESKSQAMECLNGVLVILAPIWLKFALMQSWWYLPLVIYGVRFISS